MAFVGCKKTYICQCKRGNGIVTGNIEVTSPKRLKAVARENCEVKTAISGQYEYNDPAYSCTLK